LPLRLEGHDDATVERFMTNAVEVVDRMTDALARSGRPAIVIDNGGALERSVAALRDALDRRHGAAAESMATTPRFPGGLRLPRHPARLVPRRDASPRLPGELVDHVLAGFGLTPTAAGTPVPGASRADNVIIRTRAGDKLVKRYKATVPAAAVTHEHSVLTHLARVDFPAPRLFVGPDGSTARQIDGRWFAVFDYQPGFIHYHEWLWPPGAHGRLTELSAEALAGLHEALTGFTPEGANPNGFRSLDGERWRELEWYLSALDRACALAPGIGGEGGTALRRMLDERAGAVEKELQALDAELASAGLPRQVIHGDYGPYNLLFRRGERILILDFELARIDWRVADVAKALQQFGVNRYGLSGRRIDRFLSAYHRSSPLRPDEWRLLPAVWTFLTLRRVAVCWDRFCESGNDRWIGEARRKLDLADMIRDAADRLTRPERSGTTRGDE
jgi:Ser/Thr protein kinase RdoA (MazF antagonist)